MKKFTVSALAAFGCLSLAGMTTEARMVWHFKSNGAFASFQTRQDDGYSYLSVNKGGNVHSPETWVSYFKSTCDAETSICQGVSAYGRIPNQDFTASTKSAALSTNTSGNADFFAIGWSANSSTGEYSEYPVSLGSIDLAWKASGEQSSRYVGTSTEQYLNLTWKSTGQTSESYATVTGTLGGEAVSADESHIGSDSNNDRYFEKP